MSRWDYDTVLYRVFCITLLAVAFTFTLILTNVFVDIDGLLTKKDVPEATANPEVPATESSPIFDARFNLEDKSEDVYEDKDYQDSNDLYRSKRSFGSQDILFQIKDPAVKKILTNRLITLLDELDEEEVTNRKNYKAISNDGKDIALEKDSATNKISNTKDDSNEFLKLHQILSRKNGLTNGKANDKDAIDEKKSVKTGASQNDLNIFTNKDANKEELLHLAMHNIILQGIIGNMKMENVYKKVHDLVMNFENHKTGQKEIKATEINHSQKAHNSQELKLIDELVNCNDLQAQIVTENSRKVSTENLLRRILSKDGQFNEKRKDPNVLIKTIIDITGPPNEKSNSESIINPKSSLDGVVKLVYNGRSIRFKRIEDPSSNIPVTSDNSLKLTETPGNKNIEIISIDGHKSDETLSDSSYKSIIQNYLKRISKEDNSVQDKMYSRKRLKRHIKIRYDSFTTAKPKHRSKKHDDELFVEIETHFDSHGTKGEKKKKLIKELIEKIKKAIHSDSEVKTKKHKHLHVKKRIQNPLDNVSPAFVNNILVPVKNVNHRHSDPISKSVPMHEKMPYINDEVGDNNWKHSYNGPGFLAVKTINSAELSTVDTEYDKVLSFNGIPQRLQIPLNINTDTSEEMQNADASASALVSDLGNIKFLVKDIEGSGFSIGFNQFQGETPDPESIKLFTGLENVLQTYHQKYDEDTTESPKPIDDFTNLDVNDDVYEYTQDKLNEHSISRRSIDKPKESHKHLNEYRNIVSSNLLPFNSYQAIYNKDDESNKKRMNKIKKLKSLKDSILVIDDNVFDKDLKPAEIFSIADLFDRKKRSVKVRKISNIKSKKKLSRYLNTKAMASKSVFHRDNKRYKRQIDKIRIVARDSLAPQMPRDSEEDFFVVSDEKVFADRAVFANREVLREMGMPETNNDKLPLIEHYDKHYDIYAPQTHFDIISQPPKEQDQHVEFNNPYILEGTTFDDPLNVYSRRSRLSSLMSKYPHIIMDEGDLKEEPYPLPSRRKEDSTITVESTTDVVIPVSPTELDISSNNPEIRDLIVPQDRGNYKVTVKIRPKNSTLNSGYKEVHTSINKSFNKNGLVYTSLVNVSEISKVEKMNKNSTAYSKDSSLKHQQDILKSLIKRHKSRIEEQLKTLTSERRQLETLNIENIEPEYLEHLDFSTETNNIKDKAIEITTDTAKSPSEVITNTPATTTTTLATTTTTKTTTTSPTTTRKPTTTYATTQDPDKIKMIATIERNENITNEILKKIEKNTGILETFLDKLISKIYVTDSTAKTEAYTETTTVVDKPFFNQNIPNAFFKAIQRDLFKNQSFGIPFVYAYQQHFNTGTGQKMPGNNVIYQGQIHTNALNRDNVTAKYVKPDKVKEKVKINNDISIENDVKFFKPKPGEKVLNNYILKNNTRFYLDELGAEYRKNMVPIARTHNIYSDSFSAPMNNTQI